MADERPQLPDFYAVLGVGFDATEAELRSAWRTAVKQWHPDRNPSPEAHSMMAQINEAWEVLGNPEQRAEYDTVYFTLRAAIANEERKQREEERLERERRERLRRQEQERKRREEEAARKRAIEEEERHERARRERERKEAEARRRAELERRWREQQRIEEDRREKERQERARREQKQGEETDKRKLEESAGRPEESDGRSRRTRIGGIVVVSGLMLFLGVAVAGALLVFDWPDRMRATREPVIVYVTATAVPLPTPTRSPIPVYLTATPTVTPAPEPTAIPRPDQDVGFLESIRPGSVHEYMWFSDDPKATEITRMIDSGAEFGYISDIGFGTLFIAALRGSGSDVFAALLDAGDDATRSPDLLHVLLWSDSPTLGAVQTLTDAGASLGYRDFAGRTPADIANMRATVSHGIRNAVNTATTGRVQTANPSVSSARSGNFDGIPTAIHNILPPSSFLMGTLHALVYLGAPLNTTDFEGRTVLEVAAYWGHESEVIDVLISAGADPGRSPTVVHDLLGGFGFSMDALRTLIDAGAPLNTKDDLGRTVLDVAESKGYSAEVSTALISAGAVPQRSLTLPTRAVPPTPTATPRPRFEGSPTVLHRLLDNLSFEVSVDQVQSLIDAGGTTEFQGPFGMDAPGFRGISGSLCRGVVGVGFGWGRCESFTAGSSPASGQLEFSSGC